MALTCIYVCEDIDHDYGGQFWLGTFSARDHETDAALVRASLDEALDWARARRSCVYVILGDGRDFSAGVKNPHRAPVWPPDDLEPLVRRRPPAERWKDRTGDDPPITWTVSAWIELARDALTDRSHDDEIAAMAKTAGADGWDAATLDAFLAEYKRARRNASDPNRFGWFSAYASAYRIHFTEIASTAPDAIRQVQSRWRVTDKWTVKYEAEPAS